MSFYLILDRAQIQKKYEFLGKAEAKFYSFVADSHFSMPVLDSLMDIKSVDEMRPKIADAAKAVLSKWEGVEVRNIRADHVFEFGDTGRKLHESDSIPDSLDWIMLVIELDRDVRELGNHIQDILPDSEIDSLAKNIIALASAATTPQVTAAIAITKFLAKGITHFMKKNKNDQLGLVEQSFIRELHYPNGKRTANEVTDLTGNMWYDYTIFGTE